MTDRAVLARGVEPLEDDEDAPTPLCVETLLEQPEFLEQRLELLGGILLLRQAERVARVALLEACGRPGS